MPLYSCFSRFKFSNLPGNLADTEPCKLNRHKQHGTLLRVWLAVDIGTSLLQPELSDDPIQLFAVSVPKITVGKCLYVYKNLLA